MSLDGSPGGRGSRPPGVLDLVRAHARRYPGDLALDVTGDDDAHVTYGRLDELVRDLARRFTDGGLVPGAAVGLWSDDRPEFVVGLLAAWAAGAAVVPVNPRLTAAEIRERLVSTGASVVLLPRPLVAAWPSGAPRGVGEWVVEVPRGGQGTDLEQRTPGTAGGGHAFGGTALLLATTGTTGAPKTVALTHANLAASAVAIAEGYRLSRRDATLLVMPLFHGHGLVGGLLSTLVSGGSAWLPSSGRFSASHFWQDLGRARPTWYTAVPAIHQIALAAPGGPASGELPLRFVRSCSAPLAPAVAAALERRFGAPVVSAYGMTETTHQATSQPLPADGPRTSGSVGRPTGVRVRVVSPDGGDVAPGEVGEVCVSGPTVAAGYLDSPAATAAAFVDGWFHTGDLGSLDEDGELFLRGRIKELINRGGEKISPQVVESVLLAHVAVEDAIAFPEPDPVLGEQVQAAVVVRPAVRTSAAELRTWCQAHLAPFEVPTEVHLVERIPRDAKDGGDRRATAALFRPDATHEGGAA